MSVVKPSRLRLGTRIANHRLPDINPCYLNLWVVSVDVKHPAAGTAGNIEDGMHVGNIISFREKPPHPVCESNMVVEQPRHLRAALLDHEVTFTPRRF